MANDNIAKTIIFSSLTSMTVVVWYQLLGDWFLIIGAGIIAGMVFIPWKK